MRAQRAELKPRRGGLMIAQGKRGTSAALGYGRKIISSLFRSGLARRRHAKPERKKEAGCWVALTQGGGRCATLPWATIRPPLRGSGKANQTRQPAPRVRLAARRASLTRRGRAIRWPKIRPALRRSCCDVYCMRQGTRNT